MSQEILSKFAQLQTENRNQKQELKDILRCYLQEMKKLQNLKNK